MAEQLGRNLLPVILLKFLEVGSRAIFVVVTSYSLEIKQAGQFGLIVTLQGLASFVFGYERYIDLMRRMVGQSHSRFDRAVSQALSLFAVNYTWGVPLLSVALMLMVQLPPILIGFCVVIAIAEQLMNAAYQMAMVEPRYRKMLAVTTLKNVLIATTVVAEVIWAGIDLPDVLAVWAVASAAGLACTGFFWIKLRVNEPDKEAFFDTILLQYYSSWMHFLLGLTAILTIQIDRILVGALFSFEEAGIYFRHLLLVSMLYQVFNIAFHNRILPNVFAIGQNRRIEPMLLIVRREYWNVLAFWTLAALSGVALNWVTGGILAQRYSLDLQYFVGLLIGSALRARADLNALIFNALHQERTIFRLQLTSFTVSLPLMTILALLYGIAGLVLAGGLGSLLYLSLSAVCLNRMESREHNGE